VNEHLDSLLAAIVQLGTKSGKDWTKGIGIVTWRGMMTKVRDFWKGIAARITEDFSNIGISLCKIVHDCSIYGKWVGPNDSLLDAE